MSVNSVREFLIFSVISESAIENAQLMLNCSVDVYENLNKASFDKTGD